MSHEYTCTIDTSHVSHSLQYANSKLFFYLVFQSATRVQSILQANGLAESLTCRHTSVMRSPPARRSRSSYYRGYCLFSLSMTLSCGSSWSSGLKWESDFVRCLILLSWMTSCTVGIPRSLWIMSLVTYRGASTVALNILDWHLCMTTILDLNSKLTHKMINQYVSKNISVI